MRHLKSSREKVFPRTHHSDVAEGVLVGDDLPHLGGARVVDPHGGVHELDPRGIAGGEDGVEVGGAQRRGLLEEQVLAPRGGGRGPGHVEAGGEREVDGLHVRVAEEGLVGTVGARRGEAGLGDEAAGLVLGAAADGGDGGGAGREHQKGARDLARDVGAAEDAETHRARGRRLHRRGGGGH